MGGASISVFVNLQIYFAFRFDFQVFCNIFYSNNNILLLKIE